MARGPSVACVLLLLFPLALSRHDDDFAFDNSDEFQLDLTANHSEIAKNGLSRLWGIQDTDAFVGHLFRMEIAKEAFTGDVKAYKVRTESGRRVPGWLAVDSTHGLISGVPQPEDVGALVLTVTAHGRTAGLTATDTFTIHVRKSEEKQHSKYGSCADTQNKLVLVVLIDAAFGNISPRQRTRSLMELANFMALDGYEFSIEPYKVEATKDQTMLMSGPGTTHRRRSNATTAIHFNVGCGEKLWSRHKVLVTGLREQSRDGTLAHLLQLPVLGWRLMAVKPAPRLKRQLPVQEEGSGDFEYDNEEDDVSYSGYGDDDNDNYGDDDDVGQDYDNVDPAPEQSPTPAPHPHRHHHGEPTAPTTPDTFQTDATTATTHPTFLTTFPTILTTFATILTTVPTMVTTIPIILTTTPIVTTVEVTTPFEDTTYEPATSTNVFTTEEDKVKIEPFPESVTQASDVNYSRVPAGSRANHSPVVIVPEFDTPTSTEPETQTVIIRASNETPPPSSSEPAPTFASPPPPPPPSTTEVVTPPTIATTTPSTTTSTLALPVTLPPTTETATPTNPPTTPTPETTLPEATMQETELSTEMSSTIFGRTTETVTFPMPVNQPPTLKHHMKKLAITAGKAFRYIIPADLFMDAEDGSNLTFTMYEAENVPLSQNSWIQFIPAQREVYGLPLEAHVSRWNFIVEAQDSDGAIARGPLDITVQQHKSGRTINHQFILQFKLNRQFEHAIDWQIRALEGIVNLFRDTDMDHLTVLNSTQNGDLCEFVWTNDTLPKDTVCPIDDINRLIKIMESESQAGSPSAALARAMSPQLSVSGVRWVGVGRCAAPPTRPADTFPPVTRNQVDQLTAIAGHLLLYSVPEDTFYDPEDGSTRFLKLSLRRSDRSPLPADHWLQFDVKNQEFYGLPTAADVGTQQYQLVAEDSSKKTAYDSLIVEVEKAPTIRPTVEFQMTLEYPFPMLAYNANNKRKVVKKLAALFGQNKTDSIRIQNITDNPTTIIWYNTSLPMDRCPEKEIEDLRKMIIVDERNLRENVDQIFDKDFKVMSIRLILLGLCAEQNTKTTKTLAPIQGTNSNLHKPTSDGGYTEYLVTFVIPAVAIVCMILIASVIACVLYRRRRTGKMSVGDEEERQAFRSKGIPVIFQDELEEQAATEPLHKSPVIMREEKPPLLPPTPDYRNSAPYRPPPPVAPATTPPRPKATPTYRKPPPYVPP